MRPARDNPFATWRVEKLRFRLPNFQWSELDQRLVELNYRAAIVGPHGSGKTTILEELRQRFIQQGRSVLSVRINRDERHLPDSSRQRLTEGLGTTDFVLFDGAEQLGHLAWWKLKRQTAHCGGFIVTTHRPGLLPTLVETSVSLSLLEELCCELLPPHSLPPIDQLATLYAKHSGNLRDVLRELYDDFAQQPDDERSFPTNVPFSL